MRKSTRAILCGLCVVSLISGMPFTAFADTGAEDITKVPAVEGKIPQPSIE